MTRPLGSTYKASQIIGCDIGDGAANNQCYNMVASKTGSYFVPAALGIMPAGAGCFVGWNVFSSGTASGECIAATNDIGARGLAIVGNIAESWGSNNSRLVKISGDNDGSTVENVVLTGNTFVGQRVNVFYSDVAGLKANSGYVNFNVVYEVNSKGDIFAGHAEAIGNWPVRYRTGWSYNAFLNVASNAEPSGAAAWIGEVLGVGEVAGLNGTSKIPADWVNDGSNEGSDAGGGDYTPGTNTALPTLPSGLSAFPHDLFGRAINNDGTAFAGAVQRV